MDSTEQIVILDWDDTLMPSSYLRSNLNLRSNSKTGEITSIRRNPESKLRAEKICKSLKESGTAALNLLTTLYRDFVESTSGRRLFIVTNGSRKWLRDSLSIAGALCPIYQEIKQFLIDHNTQIIYARNTNLEYRYWKKMKFEWILNQSVEQRQCRKLNVITIGDQWNDHQSIKMAPTFWRHHQSVVHHQIKFSANADARYIAAELKYVAGLFVPDESSTSVLLRVAVNHNDAIKIKFDGKSNVDGNSNSGFSNGSRL